MHPDDEHPASRQGRLAMHPPSRELTCRWEVPEDAEHCYERPVDGLGWPIPSSILSEFPFMKIQGVAYRSVWVDPDDGFSVHIFDQTRLPWALDVLRLTGCDEVAEAIVSMQVRGAPLIGAVAAYGLALALRIDSSSDAMERDAARLASTRPTAIN